MFERINCRKKIQLTSPVLVNLTCARSNMTYTMQTAETELSVYPNDFNHVKVSEVWSTKLE